MARRVSLATALAALDGAWSPKIVAALNGQHVKIARLEGEFVWHRHDDADELFLVLAGRLELRMRDELLELGPGELCVVPRGVEHCPVATEPTDVLLFEPAGTLNTGDVRERRTVDDPGWA